MNLTVNLNANSSTFFEFSTVNLTCNHNFRHEHLIMNISWFENEELIEIGKTQNKIILIDTFNKNYKCRFFMVKMS